MEDILVNVYSFLPTYDIIKCTYINKIFNKCCYCQEIWKNLIIVDFKDNSLFRGNYYETYKYYVKLNEIKERIYYNEKATCLPYVKSLYIKSWHEVNLRSIDELQKLESIKIEHYFNKIIIPAEIKKLTNLKNIEFEGDCSIEIPKEIGDILSLETFKCRYNIKSLPTEFGKLYNLKTLSLSAGYIKVLPTEIGQLYNLKELYLFKNDLDSLPTEIGKLYNLERLWAGNNRLSLPTELGQLHNLKELQLHTNNLKVLPTEFGQLNNLEILILHNNKLTSLPIELGLLSNLQILNLTNNKIKFIPENISMLPNLRLIR
jgi:Leucine-rich repeat (LRR) protein